MKQSPPRSASARSQRSSCRDLPPEEWLRLAVEAANIGTWHWDLETDELVWSERQRTIFGIDVGYAITPARLMALIHEEDRGCVEAAVARCLQDPVDYEVVFRIRRLDGEERWVQARGRAHRDAAGTPVYMAGITLDVTQRERQQAEIEALNARLQRAMRESHHRIKNNLQVVAALTELQAGAATAPETVASLERIGVHARALASIHNLLSYLAGGDLPDRGVSARAAVENLLPALQVLLGSRPLECAIAEAPLPLRQVTALAILANELVSNAAKHGAGPVELRLSLSESWPPERERRRWPRARLEVADRGPGFPPGFDPRRSGHIGIELIESVGRWDLQGDVRYENRPDGGARVLVTFPLVPA